MTYQQALNMPQWQERRLRIYERDQFSCVQCGDNTSEIQIHHRIYLPGHQPWEYPDDNLITLCKKCHTKETSRDKYETFLLYSLRNRGFSAFEILALSVYVDKYKGFRNELKNLISNAVNLTL